MENHKELSLSGLRRYIIRYGAKAMESFESDLYYDCKSVETLKEGDSVLWMVSETHTYMYTVKEIVNSNLSVGTIEGNRFNYRIDCFVDKSGERRYSMTRVWRFEIERAVDEYKKSLEG